MSEATRTRDTVAFVRDALALCRTAAPRTLVRLLVLQAAAGLAVGLELLLLRELVDRLSSSQPASEQAVAAVPLLVVLGLVVAGKGVARLLSVACRDLLAEQVSRAATVRLIAAAGRAKLPAFDDPDFVDLVERTRTSGSLRALQVVNGVSAAATAVFGCVAVFVTLVALMPAVVPLLALATVPLLWAASRNNVAYYQFVRGITLTERRRDYFIEVLTRREAAAEIRAYGLFGFFSQRYAAAQDTVIRGLAANIRQRLRRSVAGELLAVALLLVALAAVGALYARGGLGLADTIAVLFGVVQLRASLTELAFQTGELHEASLFMRDFAELDLRGSTPGGGSRPGPAPLDVLRVTDVTFRYPRAATPAITELSLSIRRGEIVGIVGENGSGKTTLALLLAGLLEPQGGRLTWNGEPYGGLDFPAREVALLPQDFSRYALTVEENIGLGAGPETVAAAAAAAGADRVIARLPAGYDTPLGRAFGGHELSGGQWQRVALARAFARDSSLVILDEPTAALDPRTEADLYARGRELFAGHAVVLIAHRFGAVRDADRILVMEEGRIVEEGDHDSLIAAGGRYAEMFELQADRYRLSRTSA